MNKAATCWMYLRAWWWNRALLAAIAWVVLWTGGFVAAGLMGYLNAASTDKPLVFAYLFIYLIFAGVPAGYAIKKVDFGTYTVDTYRSTLPHLDECENGSRCSKITKGYGHCQRAGARMAVVKRFGWLRGRFILVRIAIRRLST